jgi:hypothetical protein
MPTIKKNGRNTKSTNQNEKLKKNYNYPLKSETDPSISMEATQRNWITTEFNTLKHEKGNALT